MMHHIENLCAALIIAACICTAGGWWLTHEARQDGPQFVVTDGRE